MITGDKVNLYNCVNEMENVLNAVYSITL